MVGLRSNVFIAGYGDLKSSGAASRDPSAKEASKPSKVKGRKGGGMKNSINTFKLVRNAQYNQQANAQSRMQSASECNHSVRNLLQSLEPK